MIRQLNEGYRIPSSLQKTLQKDFEEFVEYWEEEMESSKATTITIEELIKDFVNYGGNNTWNYLFYDSQDIIFKAIKALPSDSIAKEYHYSQTELSASEIVNAVTKVLQKMYVQEHRQELENLADDYNLIASQNLEISNRPNYESLNRRRNRKK